MDKFHQIQDLEYYNIYDEISRVKDQIDTAYSNFQYAVDPDLIDCYIYEVNAAWKKYQFLLKKAKEI
ncbi:MAG: YaaL family protein [Hespellia sp.]|jgi:carbamoylphosphate synthase large subunit|nr:YaaL family protein [Hespellia sp.]